MLEAITIQVRKAGVASVLGVAALLVTAGAQAREPASALPAAQAAISLSALPVQGRKTYALIHQGGPFPYEKDGTVFGNRERLLPAHKRGYYWEYTVRTPGVRHRGARRIVCGGAPTVPEVCYYTADHYSSFKVIVE